MIQKSHLPVIFFFYCGILSASSAIRPELALGTCYSDNSLFPLLANSKDGGETWNYSVHNTKPSLPISNNNASLAGASCSQKRCVAVGSYSVGTTVSPLILSSLDQGDNWMFIKHPISNFPDGFKNGAFYDANCSKFNCIAVGSYSIDDDSSYPLLANSKNGGRTWSYSVIANNPNLKYGALFKVSCSGLTCVASGSDNGYPLLVNSNDGGSTWAYAIDSSKPDVPNDFVGGSFTGVSCSGLNCIAAGTYGANSSSFGYPLLANSIDGGVTWTYSIDSATPTLPSSYSLGVFAGASCSGSNCVAAGYYYDALIRSYPLLANSVDGGKTWTYAIDSSKPELPQGFTNGQFYNVSCSGLNCIANGGYSFDEGGSYPLIAYSKDGGVNWKYSETRTNIPSDFNSGEFFSANCSGTHCFATGGYYSNSDNYRYPLLAHSKDAGATWIYSIDKSRPSLPSGISGGEFVSAGTSFSLLPKAQDANTYQIPAKMNVGLHSRSAPTYVDWTLGKKLKHSMDTVLKL